MGFTIEADHPAYLKIIVDGLMEKTVVLSAMAELLNHPDYCEKHSYWDLSNARMGLSLQDLKEIIGVMRLYKPRRKTFANKSAIVVDGKLEIAMANMFVTLSTLAPFRYKAFTNHEKARHYLETTQK